LNDTQSIVKTSIVLLAVPFSAVGAIWLVYLLGYPMSIAVWVGMIALMGVDAETGVFMLLYLDNSYEQAELEHSRRPSEGGYRGSRAAGAAQIHDRRHHVHGAAPDHVVRRNWLRPDEAYRRAHDRRHPHVFCSGVGSVPTELLRMELSSETMFRDKQGI